MQSRGLFREPSVSLFIYVRFSQACQLPALIETVTGQRDGSRPEAAPPSLTSSSHSSLNPDAIHTPPPVRPSDLSPDCPSVEVGPVPIPDRSGPWTSRRSSWLQYYLQQGHPSLVSLPQVAPESLLRTVLRGNTHTKTITNNTSLHYYPALKSKPNTVTFNYNTVLLLVVVIVSSCTCMAIWVLYVHGDWYLYSFPRFYTVDRMRIPLFENRISHFDFLL